MLVKLIKFASAAHWECYNSAVLLLTVQKEAKSKLTTKISLSKPKCFNIHRYAQMSYIFTRKL